MMTRNCIESAQFLIQVNRKGAGWAMNPLLHIHLNPLDKPTQNGYNIVERLNKYLIKIHREVSWMKKRYAIVVDCANCAAKMEGLAQETPGVKTAAVNFMTQKMAIEFEPGADAGTVMKAVKERCEKVDAEAQVLI